MSDLDLINQAANRLVRAEADRTAVPPIREQLPENDLAVAYAVQAELTSRRLAAGERLVGRKIGLTSKAVQVQLGVTQPDYGALFASMEIDGGGRLSMAELIAPKIEAEVAFVLGRDLDLDQIGTADLLRAVEFALPALEIVDSRIADWNIGIVDTIADNGSSARFVLGTEPRRLTDLDLRSAGMEMTCNGLPVSLGVGAACLGHPAHAALWLARTMASAGTPLRAGDVVLTGALGPMVPASAGSRFEASIAGLGPVSVEFTP